MRTEVIVWRGNDAGQPSTPAWARSGDGGFTLPAAIPLLGTAGGAHQPLIAGTGDDALAVWGEGDTTFAAALWR